MTDATVRRATRADARALAGMRWDFKAEDGDLDPAGREAFLDRQLTWFTDALESDWRVWVAEREGRLVGQVFLRVVGKVPSPVPGAAELGYVTNFWVAPALRGRGIGTALLEALREWARKVPLDTLVVWPSEAAVPHYERAGFRAGEVLQLPIRPS